MHIPFMHTNFIDEYFFEHHYYHLIGFGTPIVGVFILLLILRIVRKFIKTDVHANWTALLDNFTYDTKSYYDQLYVTAKSRKIKGLKIKKVKRRTSHLLSRRKQYLRFTWKGHSYDCCMEQFGRGTFVSWWFNHKRGIRQVLLSLLPLGERWSRIWFPVTYYSYDRTATFRTYIQDIVLEVVDDITKDTGIRLSDEQRKPILTKLYKR